MTEIEARAERRRCPNCGSAVPQLHGWASWCECGWGIAAPETMTAPGRLAALESRLGARLGRTLEQTFSEEDSLRPHVTASRVLAYLVAGTWFVLLVGFPAIALWLVIQAPKNPFAWVFAVLAIGTAFVARPRLGAAPDSGIVSRDQAPTLLRLVDEIAGRMATKPPHLVVVDHRWNASWGIVGIRRRRVLTLGLPLLAALAPAERVALIAHELGHERNGDVTRGIVVGGALTGLGETAGLLVPDPGSPDSGAFDGLFELLLHGVMWLLSRPFVWAFVLEHAFLARDSQRAEYLADALAADAAGTDAVIALHEQLLAESTFFGAVQRSAIGRTDSDSTVFADLLEGLRSMPERERERRRRVARLETSRLYDFHPPTAMRIRVLQARAHKEPQVTLEVGAADRIDDELAGQRKDVATWLVDRYRSSLYYG